MGTMKAAALAPDAVLLPVDFDEYRKYSRLFKAAVREIAPLVEDRGIDEIYIDLTDLPGVHDDGGRAIGQRAEGRGAQRHRPDLLDRHHAEQAAVQALLRARQARRADAARLRRHPGAHLAAGGAQGQRHRPEGEREARRARPAHHRRHRRGRPGRSWSQHFGAQLRRAGCTRPRTGATSAPVVTHSEPVSISRETTFERDLHAVRDRAALSAHLHRAVHRAGRRPGAQGLREQDHRHQAALRRLQVGHARPHAAGPHAGRAQHPPRRGRVPEARRPVAPPAPARRARRRAGQARRTWSPRSAREPPAAARARAERAGRASTACRCSTCTASTEHRAAAAAELRPTASSTSRRAAPNPRAAACSWRQSAHGAAGHPLPSIDGLRAFEAAARLGSFERAADELNVTASAVGKRIAALEDLLGTPLFTRGAKALALTATGKEYLRAGRRARSACWPPCRCTGAPRSASSGCASARRPPSRGRSWCRRWSVSPLRTRRSSWRWCCRSPTSTRRRPRPTSRCATATRPRTAASALLRRRVLPMAAPALLQRLPPLREPRDLRDAPLLRTPLEPWAPWFARRRPGLGRAGAGHAAGRPRADAGSRRQRPGRRAGAAQPGAALARQRRAACRCSRLDARRRPTATTCCRTPAQGAGAQPSPTGCAASATQAARAAAALVSRAGLKIFPAPAPRRAASIAGHPTTTQETSACP